MYYCTDNASFSTTCDKPISPPLHVYDLCVLKGFNVILFVLSGYT